MSAVCVLSSSSFLFLALPKPKLAFMKDEFLIPSTPALPRLVAAQLERTMELAFYSFVFFPMRTLANRSYISTWDFFEQNSFCPTDILYYSIAIEVDHGSILTGSRTQICDIVGSYVKSPVQVRHSLS